MVKSRVSKKQSKASRSVRPIGFESTMRNQSQSIASSNFRAIFEDHPYYNESICLMIKFLPSHLEFGAFDSFADVVPLSALFKCAFSAFRPINNLQEVHLNLFDDSLVILTKDKYLNAINLCFLPTTRFYTPSMKTLFLPFIKWGIRKNQRDW